MTIYMVPPGGKVADVCFSYFSMTREENLILPCCCQESASGAVGGIRSGYKSLGVSEAKFSFRHHRRTAYAIMKGAASLVLVLSLAFVALSLLAETASATPQYEGYFDLADATPVCSPKTF